MQKLIAKPLITLQKERKITIREIEGKIYLFITPKRYIGYGKDIESAIQNANCNVWTTGYMVADEGVK